MALFKIILQKHTQNFLNFALLRLTFAAKLRGISTPLISETFFYIILYAKRW
jgi:hypothetical protein